MATETGTEEGVAGRFGSELALLRRHVRVLRTVMDEGPVGIIKLAEKTDEAQHKVRYSLRVLEQDGLIEPTPSGATTTPKVQEFLGDLEGLLEQLTDAVQELREASDGASSE